MPLRNPPPQVPVVTYSTPNKGDRGLIEFYNTEVASYEALDIGSPHPNTRDYPGFTLGLQNPVANDEKWIRRVWISPETNPDWFNYQIKYSADAEAYPIFIRTYREPKVSYTPRSKGSALQSIYKLVVTNPGKGYTPGTFPNLTFAYGNAKAHAVVAQDGAIAEFVLDDGGDGYSPGPTFVVDPPQVGTTIGTTATGTAFVQSSVAFLVKEDAQLYPTDSEYYAQYFQVVRIYESLPGPVLIGHQFTDKKISQSVSTQRVVPGSVTPIVSATLVEKTDPGDSIAVDTFTAIEDDHFWDGKQYSREIPDVVPVRFRVAIPTDTAAINLAGVATPPTLSTGDLEKSREQLDEFLYRESVRSRAAIPLPVTLISYKMTGDQQIETVTETLDNGLQTLGTIDELTVEGSVENLGNNQSLLSLGTVPEVFHNHAAETSIPDLIPQRFRTRLPTHVFADTVAGTDITIPPVLSTGDLSRREEQLTEFKIRATRTYRDISTLPVTLGNYKMTRDKQIETLTETLDSGLQTLSGIDELTVEASVDSIQTDALGNVLLSLKAVGTVPDLFGGKSSGKAIPNPLPPEFRQLVPTYITEETFAGNIVDPPVFSPGDIEKTETQVDEFTKRVRVETFSGVSLPITLTGIYEVTSEFGGTIAATTITLDNVSMTVDTGLMVLSSEVRNLGTSGLFLKITKQAATDTFWPTLYDTLFDEEMQVVTDRERQVVDASYVVATSDFTVETKQGLDEWKSRRTKLIKEPTAVDEATALVSEVVAPFQFPGTLDVFTCFWSHVWLGYRAVRAEFVSQLVKTWWVNSPTKPVIPFDEIITDSITIAGYSPTDRIERFHGVLHDAWTTVLGFTSETFPATTPSYEEYYLGTPDGTFTLTNIVPLNFNPGTGYTVGDTVAFDDGGGHVASIKVTSLGVSDSILGFDQLSGNYPVGTWGPIMGSGGTGTGAESEIIGYNITNYIPGTSWVGTPRVVAANVKQTDIPNLWKVETRTIVMR